jgi:hypothetical protein
MGKNAQLMQFTLTGFTQDDGCRIFAYEGVGEDRIRIRFTVRADLAMSRKYGIRLQELPLMCLGILERSSVIDEAVTEEPVNARRSLTFTEEAMSQYADEIVAAREAAALKRSSTRRQPPKDAAAAVPAEFNPYSESAPAPVKPYGQNW